MGSVNHVATVAAPVEFAFAYLSNYRNAPDWMWGLTRLTAQSETTRGVGAVFDTDIRLGSAPLLIEAVEWEDDKVVSFKAIRGLEGSATWHFEPAGPQRCRITTDVEYRVGRGLAGRALDRLIKAFTATAVRHTDKQVRANVEALYRRTNATAG